MKKLVTAIVFATFLLSVNTFAQEIKSDKKAKKAKSEKSCSTEEKKACSSTASTDKKSCCAVKAEKKA
ncbi:hypothetical protein [Flavobacterium terrae]|uniref:Uncharacterized protein n=1 Tax=Flavobacterium terrae TaxID=415425 RepID=A0A1M6H5I7_9FLAO|nr:hypothetical protein [Flavobacterium terrae]SHJ17434.1 hypothetical protein SAMN05444363_2869 [Flavobacterium terrae]